MENSATKNGSNGLKWMKRGIGRWESLFKDPGKPYLGKIAGFFNHLVWTSIRGFHHIPMINL